MTSSIGICYKLKSRTSHLPLIIIENEVVGIVKYCEMVRNIKVKFSLFSRYYAKACNEWRSPSPRHSACAARNIAVVATLSNLTGPGIEPEISRAARNHSANWPVATYFLQVLLRPFLISASKRRRASIY